MGWRDGIDSPVADEISPHMFISEAPFYIPNNRMLSRWSFFLNSNAAALSFFSPRKCTGISLVSACVDAASMMYRRCGGDTEKQPCRGEG